MDVDPKAKSGSGLDSDHAEASAPLPPTERVRDNLLNGRYLLGPELGRGGFAITYLAVDVGVASRKVVVKVLNEYRSNDAWALRKFRSEMEALARIDHPNVVSVIDFGDRPDGKPFLVMQYVAGRRLREMIPRNGLPLAQVAELIRQVGRALTAAHEVGVCHRDLKPENVIVQSDSAGEEQVKLIDFGLASIRGPGEESSSTSVSGTYSYMSPEQLQGRSSPESDVYQAGVLAYEMVTGITPFRGSTAAGILLEQMDGLKVLPHDLRSDLPESAQNLILKALSPDARDRFESARIFGDALAAALVSTQAEPAEWIRKASERHPSTYSKRQRTRTVFNKQWILPIVAAVLVAVCTTAYFLWRTRTATVDSIAVLPFQNANGDPQMAYLAEGITESLINDLSRIPTLRVSARGAVLKYDNPRVDARAAGRELGVSRVVDGSISRQGDDFFLDTELIDVRSGVRLWGNTYPGKISSLAEVLQQFSTEVTDQLRLKLSGSLKERLRRQYAIGSQAYEQYLKGRFYLNQRTAAGFQEAIRYFNQAIGANPDYAPAYSGLAETYGLIASFGPAYAGVSPAYALERSRVAAQHALQLDGTLAETYAALGFVEMQGDYDWRRAEQDFRRAITLDPNWPEGHEDYAFDLGASGRFPDAIREIEVAENLEPGANGIKTAHGLVLRMARRYDDSLALLQPIAKDPLARGLASDYIAEDYWAKSMPQQALDAIEDIPSVFTPHFRIPLLVAAYARAGQVQQARQLLHSYTVKPDTAWWYALSLAHLSLRQTDDAIADLEHAYDQRNEEVIWIGVDPMLDELRSDPRFRALLRRIGTDVK